MSAQPAVEVDLILAAIVNDNDGTLRVSSDSLGADYDGLVMSLSYDEEYDQLVIQLLDADEVTYDSDSE
jgi:hypothetical protein